MRGRNSALRDAIRDLLKQHARDGILMTDVAQRIEVVDRKRISKVLHNLRTIGEAFCVNQQGRLSGLWFPHSGERVRKRQANNVEFKRIQRARLEDQINPLVLYGQSLAGGRCASVWDYARAFQEQRV
ncbi:hypothetical protein [Polaromonas sp. JS666]|uniref:hypothetical protein n=1 Tax=Polaromonas sp. (strain JS666 / ATCC BAA-500) TaxID=296591 RepID=UPI0000464B51|nr:hypothetical protein [Polaromonas sp. JS666]